jgi:hypothetical protein
MRFSEALLLPSNLRLDPGTWFDEENNCGCLIGRAIDNLGKRSLLQDNCVLFLRPIILAEYPWMAKVVEVPNILSNGFIYGSERVVDIISHLAYSVHRGEVTLEQVADWVRTVEPSEPELKAEVVGELVESVA